MNMDKLALSTTRVLYKTIVFNLVLTTVLKVHADAPAWATTHRGTALPRTHLMRSSSSDATHDTHPGRLLASKNMPATDQYASLLAANPTLAAQLTPQFHVRPPSGWVNDPNGPLEYPNGTYHLFFQHNPVSSNWVRTHTVCRSMSPLHHSTRVLHTGPTSSPTTLYTGAPSHMPSFPTLSMTMTASLAVPQPS